MSGKISSSIILTDFKYYEDNFNFYLNSLSMDKEIDYNLKTRYLKSHNEKNRKIQFVFDMKNNLLDIKFKGGCILESEYQKQIGIILSNDIKRKKLTDLIEDNILIDCFKYCNLLCKKNRVKFPINEILTKLGVSNESIHS